MSDVLDRRDFLLYTAAAAAGVTLGEAGRRYLARADERASAWRGRRIERWATSVCRECPAACGIRVRLIDDVPVKLEGNPNCPIARGRLCAKGQAAIESYFDPDRLTGPARRLGPRGSNRWEAMSWDEATRLVAAQWPRSASTGETQPVALGGLDQGPLADAWLAAWRAAGAHVAWTATPTAGRLRPALHALTGMDADPLFDLEHATHVVSFGAPIVEDWLSPVWAQRAYGRFRRGAGHGRGRLVQIDARRSLTARKADEWIALPAEQQTILAYGLASVILREHRADAAFLDDHGGNVAAFATQIVSTCSPDDVAIQTNIPVVTILRLARELVASPRPLVMVAADGARPLLDAVFALNALIGAYDRQGGIAASPTRPADDLDDAAEAVRDIAVGRRRPAVLVLRDASPLRSLTAPIVPAGALDDVPFIVSFSPYLDEAAAIADLLLPTHTPLESWHLVAPPAAVPAELMAAAQPAVPARLNTQDLVATLHAIAGEFGGELAAAVPWNSSELIVRHTLGRLGGLRRGGPYSSAYETEWLRQLEEGGWWSPAMESGEAGIAAMLEGGGWGDPAFQRGAIREALGERGGLTFAPPIRFPAFNAVPPTAPQESPRAARPELLLIPFVPSVANLAGNPNQPVLFELLGQPDGSPWSVWAELNPETGRDLGLFHGARIRIESRDGHIEARAHLVEGMPHGHVAVAFVPGTADGRWARFMNEDLRRLYGARGSASACEVRVVRI